MYLFSSKVKYHFHHCFLAHNAVVTSAIFTPNPGLLIKPQFEFVDSEKKEAPVSRGEVFISADFQGCIKVFLNKFKPGSGYM